MTTDSYPAVGKNGFTEVDWGAYFDSRDGVVEAYAGNLDLTRIDSGNICRIAPGSACVNGFRLDVTANEDLVCAPVSSATTYYIGVQYDPALNVADGSGNASATGPCRLIITAAIDSTGGKGFVRLYSFVRNAGQNLTAVTPISDFRRPLGGPSIDWPTTIPTPPVGNATYPLGTFRFARDIKQIQVMSYDSAGTKNWVDALNGGPFPLPLVSSLVAQSGTGTTPQYVRHSGNRISFEGRVARSNGHSLSTGSSVPLGTMPAGLRPQFVQSFICRCSGVGNQVEVRINSDGTTDGQIIMTDPASACDWVYLSNVDYRIGA